MKPFTRLYDAVQIFLRLKVDSKVCFICWSTRQGKPALARYEYDPHTLYSRRIAVLDPEVKQWVGIWTA